MEEEATDIPPTPVPFEEEKRKTKLFRIRRSLFDSGLSESRGRQLTANTFGNLSSKKRSVMIAKKIHLEDYECLNYRENEDTYLQKTDKYGSSPHANRSICKPRAAHRPASYASSALRFDHNGSLVARSVLGDPAKIMKVHKDVQRKQSRQGAFNLDLPPAGLQTQPLVISPLRKAPQQRE